LQPVYIVANSIRAEVKERRERRKIKGKENRRATPPPSSSTTAPGKVKQKQLRQTIITVDFSLDITSCGSYPTFAFFVRVSMYLSK